MSHAQRIAVLAQAEQWRGTPYHHQGSVKGVGVDCAYFLIASYSDAGVIEPFKPDDYPPDWHLHRDAERYLAEVIKRCRPVDHPQPADLVVFRYGRTFSHGAIVIEWPRVIHSYVGLGVIYGDGEQGELAQMKDGSPRPRLFYSPWQD